MKKRSLITMVVALCLVAALGVGATLAYFTDKDTDEDKVQTGFVDVEVYGWNSANDMSVKIDGDFDNVVPGDELKINPMIGLKDGSVDAYVRVKITFDGLDDEHTKDMMDQIIPVMEDDMYNWVYNADDGYFYLNDILGKNRNRQYTEIFEDRNEIVFPEWWGNEMANKSFSISFDGQAIQAENTSKVIVKNSAGKICGWNLTYSNGSTFDIEKYN